MVTLAEQTLIDAKNAKKAAIDEQRGKFCIPETGYVEYMGHRFDLNMTTYGNVSQASAYIALTGALPENFAWVDYDNNPVPMTLDEFKGFATMLRDIIQNGYGHAAVLKSQVEQCTLVEEVEAIPNW